VANRFALLQLGALDLERAWLAADDTGPSALGTGLLFPQTLGLLFEQGLQSSFGESGSSGLGDELRGLQIHVESRSVGSDSVSGDNFAPLGSQTAEVLEFFGCEGSLCHDASCV
jgi:hypothetical protein